ncbi:hypothetical protein B0H13DRAFT_2371225 [Mycena leptocephala]|nr:hypothetical protein B0H13DRAFT_2371225 [Mycena leptocephala]
MSITLCALALDHARDHPSSINLDQSDSRLSGAAYDIYLGPLLYRVQSERSKAPARDTRRRWGARSPPKSQRQNPDLDFFIFFFHLAVLTPLSPRYGGFPANPRPQRRGGGKERTITAPKSGFFFSHPVRLYLPAKGALRGPFSLPNARERWGRSGIKTAKKKVFFSSLATLVGIAGPVAWPAHPNVGRSIPGARAHYRRFFFLATGRSSGLGKPPPTLANPLLVASDVGGPAVHEAGVHKKTGAGDFTSAVLPQTDDIENAVRVRDTAVSFLPSTTLVFPVLLPSASLNPGFSRTCPGFLSHLALQAFLIPLGLPQRSDHSHDPERAMNNNAAHISARDKFLDVRSVRPYAKEGPGSCYNIACVDDADIALYRAGGITGADLLARMTWKIGHSNDHERRRREYGRCDVGQTHIWVCRWEVDRRYYCERLAQLEQLCDGGVRMYKQCVCGVRHQEYFTFPSVRGFAQFRALMTGVLLFMNEPLTPIFYQPSPETRDIYNLIIQS